MDCDKVHLLLIEKQEGVISPDDEKRVNDHLLTCLRCVEDDRLISETFEHLRGVAEEDLPTHYFTNLLPRVRQRIDARSGSWPGIALPDWIRRVIAPASSFAVVGCMIALYVFLNPTVEPANSHLEQIVAGVPKDDLDGVAEAFSYVNVLPRTLEPSQRLLETVANPSQVSQTLERELVNDQLTHGHTVSLFLAADNSFEDITDDDVDGVIERLDKTSL